MFEPGNYVKWKFPHTKPQISRILERRNGHLVVSANGVTQEISVVTDAILSIAACAHCGNPIPASNDLYCSRHCMNIDRTESTDECVFAAVVEYKRTNNGLSPSLFSLVGASGYAERNVDRALKRLAKAGRIYFVGKGVYRGIAVTGGKWTYDPT